MGLWSPSNSKNCLIIPYPLRTIYKKQNIIHSKYFLILLFFWLEKSHNNSIDSMYWNLFYLICCSYSYSHLFIFWTNNNVMRNIRNSFLKMNMVYNHINSFGGWRCFLTIGFIEVTFLFFSLLNIFFYFPKHKNLKLILIF